jgi:hypothetical protein
VGLRARVPRWLNVMTALLMVVGGGGEARAQLKVTGDTGFGPLVDEALADARDRVFGVGGEVNVFLSKPKLALGAASFRNSARAPAPKDSWSCSPWPIRPSRWSKHHDKNTIQHPAVAVAAARLRSAHRSQRTPRRRMDHLEREARECERRDIRPRFARGAAGAGT